MTPEAEIAALKVQVAALKEDIHGLRADVKELLAAVNTARGGWLILFPLGAVMGTVGSWLLSLWPHK